MTEDKVYDVIIAGGGPGGTAAAARCRELGLEVLVIDYDDLMKRIRDYSKEKLILPSFGGGNALRFPQAGDFVDQLAFAPIDKDDLCAQYKALYVDAPIDHELGVELQCIDDVEDGAARFSVCGWSHSDRKEVAFRTRSVVLALGRGVPRRLDIPGNTEGIHFKLEDPDVFVGAPACVIGGGTSAAEAVIAISEAKATAADESLVYWSYRGDRMPRVNRALAEVFFQAYVGNGNIRYCPLSEPVAVVAGADRRELLDIRIDRRHVEGRPIETTHLEFPKESCLACIGEDLPTGLLAELGVSPVVGGPKGRRRLVTSRWLESPRPGVYLIGDLLSQAYFETDDFDADPETFREVRHRGNIKSAVRDGVFVAEVLRQRIDGNEQPEVTIQDRDDEPDDLETVSSAEGDVAADRNGSEGGARLFRVLQAGIEAEEWPIDTDTPLGIGRGDDQSASFPDDAWLSDRHATIVADDSGYLLRDEGSRTGVFLRLVAAEKRPCESGDILQAGQQILRVQITDDGPLVTHYNAQGQEQGRYPLTQRPKIFGRDAPDVTLNATDRTLSRRHFALSFEGDQLLVKDLASSNGSYLKVRGAVRLGDNDLFKAGQQTFRVSTSEASAVDAGLEPVRAEAAPTEPAGDGPHVTFVGVDEPVVVGSMATVCEAAEEAGVKLRAECHAGICGSDPVRIVSGAENIAEGPSEQERETLEEICGLDPETHRLACCLRIRGPVEVERVQLD